MPIHRGTTFLERETGNAPNEKGDDPQLRNRDSAARTDRLELNSPKEKLMMRNSASLFLTGILLISSAAFAQHPAAGGDQAAPMSMDCQTMMREMHGSSKAMDDRLQKLIDEMNQATGSARVDRMATVINELVTQRKQMREQMMTMMPKMMGHMSAHMKSGMMSGMSPSTAGCPMMKGAEKGAEAAPHKQ